LRVAASFLDVLGDHDRLGHVVAVVPEGQQVTGVGGNKTGVREVKRYLVNNLVLISLHKCGPLRLIVISVSPPYHLGSVNASVL
jgi:hypothetical protein